MMRKIIYLFVFQFVVLITQAQITDDFSDGDFINNPTWIGNTDNFEINTNKELQLSASSAGKSYLSTSSNFLSGNIEWQFRIKQTFSPSDNNYSRFYLVSDTSDLLIDSISGYYLRFGENFSNDAIKLYCQKGTTHTLLASGTAARIASSFDLKIKIVRDTNALWTVFSSSVETDNWEEEFSCYDSTFLTSTHIGLVCVYTASNTKKFFFDDIYYGAIVYDTIPPLVNQMQIDKENRQQIGLEFTEPIDIQLLTTNNFHIFSVGNPDSIIVDNSNTQQIQLIFFQPLPINNILTLQINNISDIAGNILQDTSLEFMYYFSSMFDVLINEIMAKPSPVVELPNYEYIELYNSQNFPINLNGWKLQIGNSTKIFSEVTIAANDYLLIVSHAAKTEYEPYGNVFSFSSFQITDAGQQLILWDDKGQLISEVSFTDIWYADNVKKNGGWSLEMIDCYNPCGEENNWTASKAKAGGTPCQQNSVAAFAPDDIAPTIENIFIVADTILVLHFNEKILDTNRLNYQIYSITDNNIKSVNAIVNNWKQVELILSTSLTEGKTYWLTINDTIVDCVGNYSDVSNTYSFVYPQKIRRVNDIVINEVLFNPRNGGVDFVEIYNPNDNPISLKGLRLSNINTKGQIDTGKIVDLNGKYINANQYLVLSTSSQIVQSQYNCPYPENFLEIMSMPAYNNLSGTVILLYEDNIIDRFDYVETMHYSMLKTTEGVSLERINYKRPTQDVSNWHSAAATVGFATPGYKNSVFAENIDNEDIITINPEIFSPDNDGYNDILQIKYAFANSGNRVSVDIYNVYGQKIYNLVNNELCGTEGYFTWDGTIENNVKAAVGNYIIMLSYWDLTGKVYKIKKTCTIAIKF